MCAIFLFSLIKLPDDGSDITNAYLMKQLLLISLTVLIVKMAWAGDIEDAMAAFGRKDYATALKKYKSAAINGDVTAQLKVGFMYRDGNGLKKDHVEAIKWYRLAAQQ